MILADCRVLLVEDNPGDVRLIQEMLADAGAKPQAMGYAQRLSDALERLEDFAPGLVLLDLSLPDSAGLDSFHPVYARAPDVPIIVLSGTDDENVALSAVHAGAQDYLIKGTVTGDLLLRSMRYAMERKRAEHALRDSERRYRELVQLSPDAIFLQSDGRFVFVNDAGVRLCGAQNAEQLLGRPIEDFIDPDFREAVSEHLRRRKAGVTAPPLPQKWRRLDGTEADVETTAAPLQYQGKRALQVVLRDISGRVQAEEARERAERDLRMVVESVKEVIFQTDLEGRWCYLNQAWQAMLGFTVHDSLGRHWSEFVHPEDRERHEEIFQRLDPGDEDYARHEVRYLTRNGDCRWIEVYAQAMVCEKRGRLGISGTLDDITERKQSEEELAYMASHDKLTGLANRNLLDDRIEYALAHARRTGKRIALLFLDLDGFKLINDSLGHDKGDLLLQSVAARLSEVVRGEDTVARLGGDEFVVLMAQLTNDADASRVAQKIIAVLSHPFTLERQSFHIRASIGITVYPKDGDTAPMLLKNADSAMYRAKELGGSGFCFYSPEMNSRIYDQLVMENELRLALERGELKVHYQPKVDLASGNMVGVEALLRWQHPKAGMVSPVEFIPIAEATGLINPIGEWVMRSACRQIQACRHDGFSLAVNLSARQLLRENLVDTVQRVLAETGFPADHLEFEITESSIMQDPSGASKILDRLHDLGISLSIDDFGTGYSSLSYIRRFPIQALKIDQSFVRDIPGDASDAGIAQAIIAMGHTLNMKVIAEGVETRDQLEFLQHHRCDVMQGYYFSEAVSGDALEGMLADGRRLTLTPAPSA